MMHAAKTQLARCSLQALAGMQQHCIIVWYHTMWHAGCCSACKRILLGGEAAPHATPCKQRRSTLRATSQGQAKQLASSTMAHLDGITALNDAELLKLGAQGPQTAAGGGGWGHGG